MGTTPSPNPETGTAAAVPFRGWLAPTTILTIVRMLAALIALGAGSYLWLGRLEWKSNLLTAQLDAARVEIRENSRTINTLKSKLDTQQWRLDWVQDELKTLDETCLKAPTDRLPAFTPLRDFADTPSNASYWSGRG